MIQTSSKFVIVTHTPSVTHEWHYDNRPETRHRSISKSLGVTFAASDAIIPPCFADTVIIVNACAKMLDVAKYNIHSIDLLEFLRDAYSSWLTEGRGDDDYTCPRSGGFIPYHFAAVSKSRTYRGDYCVPCNVSRLPQWKRVGYYCRDVMTPIFSDTYEAAMKGANVVLTMVDIVKSSLHGDLCVYGLTTLPGHHSNFCEFGGYCFINNASLAAAALTCMGRIATLDVDYHHGDGTQNIFYNRSDVLTVSLHADPAIDYPSYSGFSDEIGCDAGTGYNVNYPLPQGCTWSMYADALLDACHKITDFMPAVLVISLGVDTYRDDPDPSKINGAFNLDISDYRAMGELIRRSVKFTAVEGEVHTRIVVIQEGGYDMSCVGECVKQFLTGIRS